MTLIRTSTVVVLAMALFASCSSDASSVPSTLSPAAAEMRTLATETLDSLESGNLDDGIAELGELTHRFGDSSDADVVRDMVLTLYNSGVLLSEAGRLEEALQPYEDMAALYGDSSNPAVVLDVADGMFNRGIVLHELGRHEEELAAFEAIDDMFRDSTDPDMAPHLAKALNNKGITLYELERSLDEQLAAFEEVISRYGNSTDPANTPNLARAFFSMGFVLQAMELPAEAIEAYEEVISRYGNTDDAMVASFVDAAEQQLYANRSSEGIDPLLYELRIRDAYWITVNDDEIRSAANDICSIAENSSAEALVGQLTEAFEQDHPMESVGALLVIAEHLDYCDAEIDLMLRILIELGDV
jgi:tetratricopeptide (TPR) repeat protein